MSSSTTTSAEQVLEAVESRREAVEFAELRDWLNLSDRTLQRRLRELIAEGVVQPVGRGLYSRSTQLVLSDESRQIIGLIEELEADAHLTGFDVLAGYAHQFIYSFPHLVYVHPPQAGALRSALVEAGFWVTAAGSRASLEDQQGRTVLLRKQPQSEGLTPVAAPLAEPEKAWVDLLREVRRSQLPMDYEELGRILRAMELSGRNLRALRTYARRSGYLAWVQAAVGEIEPADSRQARLAAGYRA